MDKEDYLELLLVNDAPDAPLSQNFESNDIHLIIINTDENIGIHGARVKGLKSAPLYFIIFSTHTSGTALFRKSTCPGEMI